MSMRPKMRYCHKKREGSIKFNKDTFYRFELPEMFLLEKDMWKRFTVQPCFSFHAILTANTQVSNVSFEKSPKIKISIKMANNELI